jgi:small subunit ribosomal protein S10e
MIITKADRRTIYENLFKEGVMVAKKDYNAPKHLELDVKNLHVIKACQSLTSRGYVSTQFSWQYYYVRARAHTNERDRSTDIT